jgi:protein involved in polysaccharide export with SLBB domain
MMKFATFFTVVLAMLGVPRPALGQGPVGGHGQLSRDSLMQVVTRLEETANSNTYSEALRQRARREAELLRLRLQRGDFQTGDRIILAVERQPELSDTFAVAPGPNLILPNIREISLAGLLRAELEPYLQEQLKTFLVNPEVRATPLMRIWIEGGVTSPGVYLMPAHTLVTDALIQAGGTTREANVNAIRVERGDKRIWEGDALQRAITEGKTLDQLSLQAGDRIVVAERRGSGFQNISTMVMAIVPLIALVAAQVF